MTSSKNTHGGRTQMSSVFATLFAVLKIDVAIEVSIKIMNSFEVRRNFLLSSKEMFASLDRVKMKQV